MVDGGVTPLALQDAGARSHGRTAAFVRLLARFDERCLVRWRLSATQSLRLGLFLLGGVAIGLSLFLYLRGARERQLEVEVGIAAQERLRLLRTTALRGLEALHGIAAYLEATPQPSRSAFAAFVQGPLARLPGVQALEWIPRVPSQERAAYEARARQDGLGDFGFTEIGPDEKLVPAGARAEYYPVYFAEPALPNLPAFGLDLASQPERRSALERTLATGEPSATGPVRLAQERLPGQLGFLVYVPVYADGPVRDERTLRGFALAAFRVQDLIGPALGAFGASGLYARVSDVIDERPLFESPGFDPVSRAAPHALRHLERFEIGGRHWHIEFMPSQAFLARHADIGMFAYPFGAVSLTFLIAAYALRGMRRTLEIERRVEERTRALSHEAAIRRRAEAELRLSHDSLEERVAQRTAELFATNRELQAEISVRKHAQEDAAAARQAQSRFLASVSHEIRTPLNAIIGYSQILQRDAGPALERDALSTIVQSSHHLLVLVDEVIDLAKIESGHLELTLGDFNLGALIRDLSFMFRQRCERKGLRLCIEGLGASPWWVHGDEGKLRQILINLLGNAIKFTERGEVRLRVVPEGEDLFRFEVIDTGVGIPAHEQARIFQDFYRGSQGTTSDGSGLGLAICRRLVSLLGGTLALNSTEGWGSDFYFTLTLGLPVAVVPSQMRADRPRLRLAGDTPCRALVVDDLGVNRDVLCHMLSAVGCSVKGARTGLEALELLRTFTPEIVFLDVLMTPLDGIQTAREIRKSPGGAELKIVAYSASALENERASYRSLGFDDCLPKPFRAEQLNGYLVQLCGVRFVADTAPDAPAVSDAGPGQALPAAVVPAELRQQIRQAAELYEVTRLRAAFEQLGALGHAERDLAERLRRLTSVYDMAGVLAVVDGLREQGASAA